MIEFGDFYQRIAKSNLSHWLDTLPAQLSAWQRESLHGKFKQWFNSVEHLPALTPTRLDDADPCSARVGIVVPGRVPSTRAPDPVGGPGRR